MEKRSEFGRIVIAAIGFIAGIILLIFSGKVFENVDADEILIIQSPISGDLAWYVTPGIKWQGAGKVTPYPKRAIYEFSCEKNDKGKCSPTMNDRRIKIRFNDGGHAYMSGSIQYEMPLDAKNLTNLHVRFGSREAIQKQLVETVVNKSVYMTGPLMSSKESYAEKRNSLISLVEDQVANGVYKTTQRDEKIKDSLTGVEKTITVVKIVEGKDGLERQEDGQLTIFGIKPFNFSITEVEYDDTVEKQIQSQQQLIMQVQTAMAEAKQAEQRVITVAKEGEANAAKAKWEQEVIKAKMVTEAEQKKEVAKLERDAAEFTKQKEILLGQGESERKRLVMSADGALKEKLATYENVMIKVAAEFSKQKWVPEFQMNGAGTQGGNAAVNLIDLLTAKTARDLGLDITVRQGQSSPKK